MLRALDAGTVAGGHAARRVRSDPGANITYNVSYKNGGATADAGVVISINTPPGTTYSAINAPGLLCTTPAVGAGGLITCTVGALAAGSAGTFTLTVNVPIGATGTATLGDYQVQATGVSPLLGNVINTIIGCTADSQCAAGNWCDETLNECTPTLANGTPLPTDPGHNPVLNGTCTAAAGALVCTSAVCDTDNDCGYENGDGPCTGADATVVCRSAVCDPDGDCGYANGDGPCVPGGAGNGPAVCRSGVCSTNGTCEPLGGCNVDADCTGGNWCLESTHTCTPRETNGSPVPTDPTHTSPTLNGVCTAAAGALVCVSGVCDTDDNDCGYAIGDGPCSVVTSPVVCRSGTCSTTGVCIPVGGCVVDANCTAAQFCDTATFTCTPKEANGVAIPTIAGHTPPLTGTCTVGAGASVCTSGVCDTADNKCGYANGDGSCTAVNGGVVCRSGACSTDGTCEPAGGCEVDADCTAANYCDTPTTTCVPKVANGQPVPTVPGHAPALNGTCTALAGVAACASGVCDTTDNDCGYANGDGPCTAVTGATVCRSGACSTSGTCEPSGGCNVDADCTAGNWCDETTHICTGQLANGTAVPVDGAHTSPTLDGTCTAAAGTLVCTSGVCDTKDNECGYANGDGPCTATNGATVCRSGDCSPTGGVCISTTGCAVDADCSATQYCDTPTAACVAKVANGQAVPTVTGHSPTLDGTCTTAAGAAACASGVCDTTDNKCGYANGDGPCTATNGATDCRSAACSTNGTCEPAGGCNVDADCSTGKWCNETMHACVAQLANGTAVPTDASHTNPTLNGTCTTAAGALVCASGVCDVNDNKCGYANGDGPCTSTDGTVDCRSTICATTGASSGLCVACLENSQCPSGMAICDTTTNTCVECTTSSQCPKDAPICQPSTGICTTMCTTDADCGKVDWCDITSGATGLCTAKIANGKPLPTTPSSVATCTAAVGKRVCISGVCDPKDNDCGPTPDAGAPSDAGNGDASVPDAAVGLKPLGATCTLSPECQSDFCSNNICSETISSGNGVVCAVRNVGSSGEPGDGLGVLGVMLGLAGLRVGRRRAGRSAPRA
jgi:hypothetical protein